MPHVPNSCVILPCNQPSIMHYIVFRSIKTLFLPIFCKYIMLWCSVSWTMHYVVTMGKPASQSLSLSTAHFFLSVSWTLHISKSQSLDLPKFLLELCTTQFLNLLVSPTHYSNVDRCHEEKNRLGYFQTDAILSWVDSICKYSLSWYERMILKEDSKFTMRKGTY